MVYSNIRAQDLVYNSMCGLSIEFCTHIITISCWKGKLCITFPQYVVASCGWFRKSDSQPWKNLCSIISQWRQDFKGQITSVRHWLAARLFRFMRASKTCSVSPD